MSQYAFDPDAAEQTVNEAVAASQCDHYDPGGGGRIARKRSGRVIFIALCCAIQGAIVLPAAGAAAEHLAEHTVFNASCPETFDESRFHVHVSGPALPQR